MKQQCDFMMMEPRLGNSLCEKGLIIFIFIYVYQRQLSSYFSSNRNLFAEAEELGQ